MPSPRGDHSIAPTILDFQLKEQLVDLLGAGVVSDAPEILEAHAGGKWFASHAPEIVVFAESRSIRKEF